MEFYNHQYSFYKGLNGFVSLYNYALKYAHIITEKAKRKAKVLAFWETHGLAATLDAFPVKRSTLFLWKQTLIAGNGKFESLNDKSRSPRARRKRLWPLEILEEIRRLRDKDSHPNLGKEKIYPELMAFCTVRQLRCPKITTIGRLIKDMGGLRTFPRKIGHDGKIKPLNRQKVLRKPKDLHTLYPGHVVALDTIERIVHGRRRYLITFEDIYTRFGFAWATTSHASLAAKDFFLLCQQIFPCSFAFLHVLTDNGSEFKKHFAAALRELHLTHYHTYPKTLKMNAHVERFNRTIQEEFVDYHAYALLDPDQFKRKLIDWLLWYNTRRVHHAFKNRLSPLQFMLSLLQSALIRMPQESKSGWRYTET